MSYNNKIRQGNNKRFMIPKVKPSRPSTTSRSSRVGDSSRLSLTTQISQVNKYPKCEIKKHNKELLNLVCLTETCKTKGVICSMCRSSQHSTHIVMPVRKLLQKLQQLTKNKADKNPQPMLQQSKVISEAPQLAAIQANHEQKMKEEEPQYETSNKEDKKQVEQQLINQINKCKDSMLFALSLHVKAIAEEIMKVEEKIILQADQAIQQIKNVKSLQKNIQIISFQLKNDQFNDSVIFKNRINTLLECVKCKSKQTFQLNANASQNKYNLLQNMSQSFIQNIKNWHIESNKLLQKVFDVNIAPKQKENAQKQASFKFSPELKIKSIELSNENKTAKLIEKLSGFIILNGPATLKQKTVKLKIAQFSSGIMVGVGFKDILKANNYTFLPNSINHGVYMIANNSMIYSHSNKANNAVAKGIFFTTGQQISIILKGDTVVFVKKSDSKSLVISLKKMAQQDWKQLCVCVWLGGIGDKVEIIQ